jgi:hypothetical protein
VLARVGGQRNIPPHHLEATTPEAAYVMAELFPQHIWDATGAGLLLGASEDADSMEKIKQKGAVSSNGMLGRHSPYNTSLLSWFVVFQFEEFCKCVLGFGASDLGYGLVLVTAGKSSSTLPSESKGRRSMAQSVFLHIEWQTVAVAQSCFFKEKN